MPDKVSFIHLSDIHLNRFCNDAYDLDSDLRDQLILDIQTNAIPKLENIRGILICGDIAFSGNPFEYEQAKLLLQRLCGILDIDESLVFCVPGNHDVDQAICRSSKTLMTMQANIESAAESAVELATVLRGYANDSLADLYASIKNYNAFASQYDCNLSSNRPMWSGGIELGADYLIRIHGLNSVIISSHLDHADGVDERKMVVGLHQVPKQGSLKNINLSLCHHPPQDWLDPDNETVNMLNARCHVQLYGHRHVPAMVLNSSSLIVGSGAMQPSRTEGNWIPCYNWITISVDEAHDGSKVVVELFPRKRSESDGRFTANSAICIDGRDSITYKLPVNLGNSARCTFESDEDSCTPALIGGEDAIGTYASKKKMVYDFMNLPFLARSEILFTLKLLDEDDDGLKHEDIMGKVIQKVFDQGLVDEFCCQVEQKEKE